MMEENQPRPSAPPKGLLKDNLFTFVLPGQTAEPRAGLNQAQEADRMGHRGIFLSERWESKEAGAMLGALAASTERVTIVAGMTHCTTRHPLVQAGMAQTLQMLSGDRFVLGYGRGVPSLFRKLGIRVLSREGMADHVAIMRKLWAGETVRYHGPAGDFPEMQLPSGYDRPPPVILGAIGPESLKLGGAHFDGVALHPFLTADGVARSIAIVKQAAQEAGRDPDRLTFWATVVTAPDNLPEGNRIDIVEARAVSYFMHDAIGHALAAANGWDPAPLRRVLEADLARLEYGTGTIEDKRRMMADAASLLPPEWLSSASAVGSERQCLDTLGRYWAAGVDYILLHGTTPVQQAGLFRELGKAAP